VIVGQAQQATGWRYTTKRSVGFARRRYSTVIRVTKLSTTHTIYSLEQIDENWSAVDTATLVFVLDGDRVLLIRKKRGLGAGKINGPGGKLEPGETAAQCAVREVKEELCIAITDPRPMGELRFQFIDGYSIHVHVYLVEGFNGEPTETDEAIPLWFTRNSIPYREMWADDAIWLPKVLDGHTVEGRFVFAKDIMLAHEVIFGSGP